MDITTYMSEKCDMVNQALERFLPPSDELHKTLLEAMRYSLFAGGKRIRPILCIAGCETAGGKGEDALPFACAIELIHTYSLIHDDLPGMDNDDFRRGVPTCHKRFSEAAAILAGDALLTEAFYLMTNPYLYKGVDPGRLLTAAHNMAAASGYRGMVGGQMVDVESEGKEADLDLIRFIHKKKTAALIEASTTSGAYLVGAPDHVLSALSRYGLSLGLAFQIRDDILDVIGESDVMGKPQGSDDARKKATYAATVGLEQSRRNERRMVQNALAAIKNMNSNSEPLQALALYLLEREY